MGSEEGWPAVAWAWIQNHWVWLTGGGIVGIFALVDGLKRGFGWTRTAARFIWGLARNGWRCMRNWLRMPAQIRALQADKLKLERRISAIEAKQKKKRTPPEQEEALKDAKALMHRLCSTARAISHLLDNPPKNGGECDEWERKSKGLRSNARSMLRRLPDEISLRLDTPVEKTQRERISGHRGRVDEEHGFLCAYEIGLREAIYLFAEQWNINPHGDL